MKYRICWKSKVTGAEGHEEPTFDTYREAASAAAKSVEYRVEYWVEAIADDSESQEGMHPPEAHEEIGDGVVDEWFGYYRNLVAQETARRDRRE